MVSSPVEVFDPETEAFVVVINAQANGRESPVPRLPCGRRTDGPGRSAWHCWRR